MMKSTYAVIVALGLVACSGSGDSGGDGGNGGASSSAATVQDAQLLTTVEVPAGALPAGVVFGVEATLDEEPLPAGKVRIGPQFKLTPDGTKFAKPVRWTLPLDGQDRDRLGNSEDDVKVWVRTKDGWNLTEPVAFTASSVTIEVSEATTAAAGVSLRSLQVGCLAAGQPPCSDPVALPPVPESPQAPTTCTGEFCTQVVVAAQAPTSPIGRILTPKHVVVQDGNLYWLAPLGAGGLAHRKALDGGPTVNVTGPNGGIALAQLAPGSSVAVDTQGNLWSGGARFKFGTAQGAFASFPEAFATGKTAPDGLASSADPLEVVRTGDGSIHAYRRLTRQPQGGGAPTDVAMERWVMNPDLSVTGPVAISKPVGKSLVIQPDPTESGTVWMFGRLKPATFSLLSDNAAPDGVRILRVNSVGKVLTTLDVLIQADGLAQNNGADTGLCSPTSCNALGESSFSVRGTELIAPTRPSVLASKSLQKIDGGTRTTLSLPAAIDPIIDVVHDSQGGVWMFTRNGSPTRTQVSHFNRTTNVVKSVALGGRTPFGISSDGGDGVIVVFSEGGGLPSGLLRVRRLVP